MKVDKIDLFLRFFLILVIVTCTVVTISEYRKGQAFIEGFESNYELDLFTGQGGRWSGAGFYCVRTDSPFFDAENVDVHEQCHELVYQEEVHFCD